MKFGEMRIQQKKPRKIQKEYSSKNVEVNDVESMDTKKKQNQQRSKKIHECRCWIHRFKQLEVNTHRFKKRIIEVMRGSQTNFIKLLSNKHKYKLKVEFLKKKK